MRLQLRFISDPRSFWRFANNRRNSIGIPSIISLGEEVADTPSSCSELFAKHFSSVFVDPDSSPVSLSDGLAYVPSDIISCNTVAIDDEVIYSALKKFKNCFSPGPDGIPACILKKFSTLFVPILKRLYVRGHLVLEFLSSLKEDKHIT